MEYILLDHVVKTVLTLEYLIKAQVNCLNIQIKPS
jgi:hypothetical protein